MKAYKLTDENNQTRNKTQWGENIAHTAVGEAEFLCSDAWIHFYTDPLLATLLNPIHAHFYQPRLWECETSGEHKHDTLKSGCRTLTTIKEIPLPEVTPTQRVVFAILCVKEVYKDEKWNKWADNWLNNVDRSLAASRDITRYTDAYASYASYAANSASSAAMCVTGAAVKINTNAAYAAEYTSNHDKRIDFVAIAHKALTYT